MKFYKIIVLLIVAFCSWFSAYAQNYVPDKKGYVADPAFKALIKQKGYQLVTVFDTFKKKPLLLVAKVIKDDKVAYINTKGEMISLEKEQSPYTPNTNYQSVSVGGGISIDEPVSSKTEMFEQVSEKGKVGTRNKTTKQVGLPVIYDGMVWYNNGMVTIKKDEKVGVATSGGKILLAPKYDEINIEDYTDSKKAPWYRTRNGNKFGVLNSRFEEVIVPKYTNLYACGCDVSNNLLMVSLDSKSGLASKSGKEILPPIYDNIRTMIGKSMPIMIKLKGKTGLVDTTGKMLLEPVYDRIDYETDLKLISLEKGNMRGFADIKGKIIVPPVYRSVRSFNDGFFIVEKENKYGVVNKMGVEVLAPVYDDVNKWDKYLMVAKADKRGLLDLRGKVVVPLEYQELAYTGKNIFFKKDEKYGLMSPTGKKLIDFKFEKIEFANGYFIVSENGKYGVADDAGKVVIPIKYTRIRGNSYFMRDGTLEVTQDGQRGRVDRYGNEYFR